MENNIILGVGAILALLLPATQPEKELEYNEVSALPQILWEDAAEEAISNLADSNNISSQSENDNQVATNNSIDNPLSPELPAAPSKNPSNLPPNDDTVVRTNPERGDAAVSYNGMTQMQYEDAVKYMCPSQIPDNRFTVSGRSRLNSIGKYSRYVSTGIITHNTNTYPAYYPTELARVAELSWDYYKMFNYGRDSTFVDIDGKVVVFYFDWNDLSVSWGKENRDKATQSVQETADMLANSVTAHLRSLEAAYVARCPND